jgi:sugar phosphate isomerase/epimerase
VLFDAVNLLSIHNHQRQVEVIDEAWRTYGHRIQIVHAKDFVVDGSALKPAIVGEGLVNWPVLLKHIRTRKPGIEILLEDTQPATIDRTIANFRRMMAES